MDTSWTLSSYVMLGVRNTEENLGDRSNVNVAATESEPSAMGYFLDDHLHES